MFSMELMEERSEVFSMELMEIPASRGGRGGPTLAAI